MDDDFRPAHVDMWHLCKYYVMYVSTERRIMCTICAQGAQNEMQHLQIYRVCAHNVNNEILLVFPQFRGKLEVIGWIFLPGLS